MIELRCGSGRLHATVLEEDVARGTIEIGCRSSGCGKRTGVVVLHTFNIQTGALVDTRTFQEPSQKGVNSHGTPRQGIPLRASGRQADAVAS